ncbi:hypothetical protein BDW62DRAFT_191142 [Aspergillus aurantiobrunneus]
MLSFSLHVSAVLNLALQWRARFSCRLFRLQPSLPGLTRWGWFDCASSSMEQPSLIQRALRGQTPLAGQDHMSCRARSC